jgi:uncharacterized SAM-binding protein YcdF (DUF218 family)
MKIKLTWRRASILILILFVISIFWLFVWPKILTVTGRFLIKNDLPHHADAVVVLYTGVDYYPRLMEAAWVYRKGIVKRVVIDGNRKNDSLRLLEDMGFKPCCPWYEDTLRMLELLGVPRDRVITISAEDAFDTISEAEAVAPHLLKNNITRIVITTSKFHSHRASYIWRHLYGNGFEIFSAPAQEDEFDPRDWWHDREQIRWVLSEYGGWISYFWEIIFPTQESKLNGH